MKKITLLLVLFLIFSVKGYTQLFGQTEDFENTTGISGPLPATWTLSTGNWAVFERNSDPNFGTTQSWGINAFANGIFHSPIQAASVSREQINAGNTSEDFLATSVVSIPATGTTELHFWTRMFTSGNQGTIFKVMVAPAAAGQTDPNSYTDLEQWTELNLIVPTTNFNVWTEKTVTIPAFLQGQDVYFAFVRVYTQPTGTLDGDRWLIDDVGVNLQCTAPTTQTTTAITSVSANLNWTNPGGATSFTVVVTPTVPGNPFTFPVNGTGPYQVTGLTPNTQYTYTVTAICPTGFSSPPSAVSDPFTTQIAPPVCGGNLVDSGGTAANYGNNENVSTTVTPNPGDVVTVTFTAFNTQANNDILRIYDGPDNTFPLLATLSGTTLPPSYTSTAAGGQLTFVFTSNATTTAAGYAANITCGPAPACRIPTAVSIVAGSVTTTGVSLNWTQPANPDTSVATVWDIITLPGGSPVPNAGSVPTFNDITGPLPYSITGLTPATCYDVYVRAVCNGTTNSGWSAVPVQVCTLVAPPICGGNFVDSGGTGANYSNNENLTTVISPINAGDAVTVTFTAFNTELNNDILRIYDGNGTIGTTLLATLSGTALPPSFTSSAPGGQLTFVFTSNGTTTAAGWVANVTCAPQATCAAPTALSVASFNHNSATLNWTQPANPNASVATMWDIYAVSCGSPVPTASTTPTVNDVAATFPYVLTNLTPNTCYTIYVRAVCSGTSESGWITVPVSVTTLIAPPECGGNFVDAGGIAAPYAANSNVTTVICPTNPGDVVTVTFTSFNTETNFDALYVYNGNAVVPANLFSSSNPAANVPGGLAGGYWGTTIPCPFTSSTADGCLTFVFRSDGSVQNAGWVANVTCAPPPTCATPTLLTSTTVTHNSAMINWTQPANADLTVASMWDIIALPCGSPAPTASSVPTVDDYAGALPYTLTNLTPATCYNIYVRAVCGTSNSEWNCSPLVFTTQAAPPVCGGNFTDAGGIAAPYAANSNVTTTICPTNPGEVVTVTFTSFNTETNFDALYVYHGNAVVPANLIASANPAANVPGGLAGGYWGTALPCPFTSISADGCLTFVFRSDGSVQNAGWVANITCGPPPTCATPTALTSNTITHNSVIINWTQPANADTTVASMWDIIVLPCGSPAPTAASTPTVNDYTGTLPYTLTNLTPATCYNIYVRAVCGPTDSPWQCTPLVVTTLAAPPICGGNFVDEGGTTANYLPNSNVTTTICPTNPGDVVTVTFTSFNTEANWDALYVYHGNAAVPANLIPSANPAANVPGGLAGGYWGTALPCPFTSASSDGCLTFVFRSDGSVQNPGWVANITCGPPAACATPASLTATNVRHESVLLNWTQPVNGDLSVASAWDIITLPCGSPAPTASSTPTTTVTTPPAAPPYNLTGLTPLTCYDIYIRANCGPTTSPWICTPVTITTLATPPSCGEVFTDAGGTAGPYANNSNLPTYICPTNPGDVVTVTFTSFNTQANIDGLYVYDGDVIGVNQIASANGAGTVPGGLPGSYWGNLTGGALPGPFTSTTADGCLTFVFRSNGTTTAAGWEANVTCAPAPTCARPLSITANPITQTTAQLNWVQPLNPNGTQATQWQVQVLPAGSGVPPGGGILVTGTPTYFAQNLTAGTTYEFYVRAVCGPNDISIWSGFTFSTPPTNDECANAAFAIVNQNLNCIQTVHGTLVGATASSPPTTCGGAGAADNDVWFQFTATTITHIISFTNVTGVAVNDIEYAIYSGSCTGLTEVGCNSGANLIAGTTYYIRVFSAGVGPVPAQFDMCVGTLPCTEAPAFCTGQTVTYDNSTNVPSLGQIGCLFTSPNPAFFFLQVNNAGPLSYLISQVDTGGTPRDVDYVAWGPFTDLNTACTGVPANPLAQTVPIPTPTTGCPGTLHACSYSIAPQEIMCIPNAQLCEVYVIMITNFSNQAGTVTFTQTNTGGGTTACFPINTFNYSPYVFCQNMPNPTPVLAAGATAGTYSSTPGLVFVDSGTNQNSATGTIDLAASTPGNYIVTSTTATTIGGTCNTIPFITTTRTVIITAPASATISYAASPYCNTDTSTVPVIRTGTIGGTYSAPVGLIINATTGDIFPSASAGGVYTVTYSVPATGGCAAFTTTTQVEIIDAPVPTFTQVAPICPGDALAPLPTSSNDTPPITGTWSPAINNTATTTYTFTPDAGQCAEVTTMTINVGSTVPTFTQVPPICAGAPLAALPTTSNDTPAITGVWSPALDNTQTTTYTFTPTSGVCIGNATMTIQVLPATIVPTFNAVPPICPNGTLAPLPTSSTNVPPITGTWSPALDNTQTTTYTFTPDTGQCALTTTLTVVVNPPLVVSVNSPTFCPGSSATVVATPAIPGTYTYTWTVPQGVPDPGNVASFVTTTPGTYSVVIDQVSNFCNTDFETPLATGTTPNLVAETLVPCWDTTSGDGIIEIWPPGFEGVTAYSGNQLIELNGNTPGTLFQDFLVIPGTTMSVSFAHRGRQGIDVVGVEIGPVGGPYVSLGNFSDGNTAWALHTVNYTIPTGSGNNYTLRFVSVSSAGGSPSIGNLLDSISISALSCTSAAASGVASLQNLPDPTVTVTDPTCTVQSGTIEVTSPLNVGGLPANLFISEVTDSNAGSLTYIEIYNGTGAPVDLSNYKLRTFNNGSSTVTLNCDNILSGILNNNSVHVVGVGSATNQGGVVPHEVFATCTGVNIDDNIRLSTLADVDIDVWGAVDGSTFTPANQPGYTYRRINTATVPSATFNAVDWTAIDPEDYTNVGSYVPASSTFEYSLDGGTYQAGTTFSGVTSGAHTITVHDLVTGCYSLPFSVTVGQIVGQLPTVTTITYTTPVCKDSTVPELPDTSAAGFTSGGTYSEITTTGLSIDPNTGEINLAASSVGFHTVQYEVLFNSTTCQAAGVSTFVVEIRAVTNANVLFTYPTPVCSIAQATITPTLDPNFTLGGTFTANPSTGITINANTGVITLTNAATTPNTYAITYTVQANAAICQSLTVSNAIPVTITPATAPTVGFHYDSPVCADETGNPMPILDAGFVTGGVFGPTPAVDATTGEVTGLTAGQTLTVTYTLAANNTTCQSAGNSSATITKSMPILVELSGGCQNVYVLNVAPVGGSFDPNTATYSWQNASGVEVGTSQSLNPVPAAGEYTVTVTVNGCSTESAPFNVASIACQIQKGISVNNDNFNDTFDLTGFDVKKLTIFNRYGTEVYSKANYVNEWGGKSDDGDELPDGTYFYVLDKNSGGSITGWIYINRAQ